LNFYPVPDGNSAPAILRHFSEGEGLSEQLGLGHVAHLIPVLMTVPPHVRL
jgi:hypothetical protein